MIMLGKNILIERDHFIAESGEDVIKPISSLSNRFCHVPIHYRQHKRVRLSRHVFLHETAIHTLPPCPPFPIHGSNQASSPILSCLSTLHYPRLVHSYADNPIESISSFFPSCKKNEGGKATKAPIPTAIGTMSKPMRYRSVRIR
jgi:hypothetical protein